MRAHGKFNEKNMSFASTTKMIQPFCTVHHAHCIPSKHDSLWFPYSFYDSINAKFFALSLSQLAFRFICVCRQFHRHTISNGTHFKPHFSGGITTFEQCSMSTHLDRHVEQATNMCASNMPSQAEQEANICFYFYTFGVLHFQYCFYALLLSP